MLYQGSPPTDWAAKSATPCGAQGVERHCATFDGRGWSIPAWLEERQACPIPDQPSSMRLRLLTVDVHFAVAV